MALDDDDVREILRLIDESELDELLIDTPDLQLHVRRGGARAEADPAPGPEPAAPIEPGPAAPVSADGAGSVHTVESPLLGVFYRASAPGAAPFVEPGARVEPGTVLCLIEVMKMMNSIEAGIAGTVVEICVQNAELVEHGQPLFRIEPA
jgi:acetyl-CoA carboxylase biotin carboxyl carrier protein